jgi:hypothetical protein
MNKDGDCFIMLRSNFRTMLCFHYVALIVHSVVNCADNTVSVPRMTVSRPPRSVKLLIARRLKIKKAHPKVYWCVNR